MLDPAIQQYEARVDSLRSTAFERELGVDLRPTGTFLSDECVRRELDFVEEHFIEMSIAGQILDGRTEIPGSLKSMMNCDSPLCRSSGLPEVRTRAIM